MAGYIVSSLNGVTIPNAVGDPTFYPYNSVVPLAKLLPANYQWMVLRGILSETESGFSGGGGSVAWGSITGTLSSQTDLNTALNSKLNLTGGTLTGKLITAASATGSAGIALPHGAAPTTPSNGDVWTTTAGMYVRINGTTVGPLASSAGGATWGSITGTLSSQTDLQSALDAKLNLSGGTLTGDLTINKTAPRINLEDVAGQAKYVKFRTGTSERWVMGANNGAESGSNAGSDFHILRYTDAGALIDSPLTIIRQTGWAYFSANVNIAGATTLTGTLTANGVVALSGNQHTIKNGTPTTLNFVKASQFGYSSGYRTIVLGDTGTTNFTSVAIGVDVVDITSGAFSGDGREVIFRNAQEFMTPNSGRTAFLKPLVWDSSGNSTLLGLTVSGQTTLTGNVVSNISLVKTSAALQIYASSGASTIYVDRTAGNAGQIQFRTGQTASGLRWNLLTDSTAESGSNAGSDFVLQALSDTGTALSTPLKIIRSTGTATFSGALQSSTSLGITSGPTWVNDAGKWMTSSALRVDGAIYAISTLRFGGTADVILQRDAALTLGSNSDITITKANALVYANSSSGLARFAASSVAGQVADVQFYTGSSSRWSIRKNTAAESGSNAGSDLEIAAFTDAGGALSTPLTITRSTGAVSLTGDLSISKASPNFTMLASSGNATAYLASPAGGTSQIVLRTGSFSNRWIFGKESTAESGSNAGSNFTIAAYDDAGALLSTPLTITRSTGAVTLSGALSVTGTTTLPTATSIGSVSSTEIGYLSGVTSSIQTQLAGKSDTSHTHLYAGSSSAGGAANSVANSLAIKFDSGTTEGTDLYTFNGSAAKTLNIVAGSNITLTETSGQVTIASTGGGGGGTWGSITGTLSSQTDLNNALEEKVLCQVMDIW